MFLRAGGVAMSCLIVPPSRNIIRKLSGRTADRIPTFVASITQTREAVNGES
ncbi:unnamed protein product [Periconia digitata]|uniref:Uncharacterized protein n=1 Tax=Periconia digitata TaxID=1303443 RepID=A0A9W4UHQ0_9PLEO|nr:unnamed protein product [Periconia digitata]